MLLVKNVAGRRLYLSVNTVFLFNLFKRQSFHLLLHFPVACNGQDWRGLKPRTRNSTLVSHIVGSYMKHP